MAKNYSYYSNVLKRPFETVAELEKAEEQYNQEVLAKQKAQEERKARAVQVEEALKKAEAAYKEYRKLLAAFCKDYGSYHTTVTDTNDATANLIETIFKFF